MTENARQSESLGPSGWLRGLPPGSGRPGQILRYVVGLLAAGLALLGGLALDNVLHSNSVFPTFLLAVLVVNWCCGPGPCLVTTFVGAALADWFLLPPRGSVALAPGDALWRLGTYLVVSLAIAWYGLARRRTEARLLKEEQQRKSAEAALRANEARYRSLFENMLDGFAYCRMIFDPQRRPVDFIYLEVNEAFGKLTGLEGAAGKPVSEVIPGLRSSHPEVFEIYGRVAATGKPERFEIEIESLGSCFSVSVYCPQPDHFVAVFDNITERKRAAEALQANEEHYRVLSETMPSGVVYRDVEGRIISLNPAAERILGRSAAQLLGQKIPSSPNGQVLRPDGSPLPVAEHPAMVALETGKKVSEVLMQIYNPQLKEYRWVETSAVPLFRPGAAKPFQVYTLFRDITERRRMEQLLREREEEFRKSFELPSVGQAQLSPHSGRFLRVNGKFCEITGYSGPELLGMTLPETIHPADREAAWTRFGSLVRGDIPFVETPVRFLHKQGNILRVELAAAVIWDQEGRPLRITAALNNATPLKQVRRDTPLTTAAVPASAK